MEGTAVVWILGLIALATVVQAAFLVALAVGGLKLFRRVDELSARLDREIKPALDGINRITRNFGEMSDLATLQVRRIDYFLADTVDKLEDVTTTVRSFVTRPPGPLGDITAFWKGLRKGFDVYRQLGGFDRRGRAVPRRAHGGDDDEHLFI